MATVNQIIETLKSNKLAKGTKITLAKNCVTIYYPKHKVVFADSQFNKDLSGISSFFGQDVNKETLVTYNKNYKNRGAIQIYVI